MRTIIRFSLNNDSKSKLRNSLNQILTTAGLERISTATYEGDVSEIQLRKTLATFWRTFVTQSGKAHLDHFWMYIDNKKRPRAKKRSAKK
jgi:CRISPR-associated endonuclease Cas2